MKKSFIILTFVAFSTLFLFSSIAAKLLVPDKVQAYTPQDCYNITYKCNTLCSTYSNGCESCAQEMIAACENMQLPQPPVQQPPVQQTPVQQPPTRGATAKQLPTAVPQESLPITAIKGQPFKENLSGELVALLGPDSSGGPYSFNLDTMGGFPPMGLILGPDGVLKGTPTGTDSKFRACVKDAGGNTACKVINIDVKKEGESELLVPSNFQLTELAYNNLTSGKQFKSGESERIAIKMPDGSLMQMDLNSIIIPVSDYQVKSDAGRFRFDYKPANGGNCAVGDSPTWACRQVDTRDATLRVKGTEFLVDTDKYGTNITVIKGLLIVSDTKGKKTVEVSGGQYAYIKKGGLPTNPVSFDSSQVERWWEEKTGEQIKREVTIGFVAFFLVIFLFVLLLKRKKISESLIKNKLSIISFVFGIITAILMFKNYLFWFSSPLLRYMPFWLGDLLGLASPLSLMGEIFGLTFGFIGLTLGIIGIKSSKKILAIVGITFNVIGIVLWMQYFTSNITSSSGF